MAQNLIKLNSVLEKVHYKLKVFMQIQFCIQVIKYAIEFHHFSCLCFKVPIKCKTIPIMNCLIFLPKYRASFQESSFKNMHPQPLGLFLPFLPFNRLILMLNWLFSAGANSVNLIGRISRPCQFCNSRHDILWDLTAVSAMKQAAFGFFSSNLAAKSSYIIINLATQKTTS